MSQLKPWRITFRDEARPPIDITGHLMFDYNIASLLIFPDEPEILANGGAKHKESVCAVFPLSEVHHAIIKEPK